MTDGERWEVDLWLRSLNLLHVSDDGLAAHNLPTDMEAIVQLVPEIKAITTEGATPFELAVYRLADLTPSFMVTYVVSDRQLVKQWMIARTEVVLLRLASN